MADSAGWKSSIQSIYPAWWTNILLWNITIFNGKIHYKWPFSIAMLVHQRVIGFFPIAMFDYRRVHEVAYWHNDAPCKFMERHSAWSHENSAAHYNMPFPNCVIFWGNSGPTATAFELELLCSFHTKLEPCQTPRIMQPRKWDWPNVLTCIDKTIWIYLLIVDNHVCGRNAPKHFITWPVCTKPGHTLQS